MENHTSITFNSFAVTQLNFGEKGVKPTISAIQLWGCTPLNILQKKVVMLTFLSGCLKRHSIILILAR